MYTMQDILLCQWYGFRLSLKTAGMIALIGGVLATLPQIAFLKWPSEIIRRIWSALMVLIFTIAFLRAYLTLKYLIPALI